VRLDQQILAELQKLNRRMDTLNTRLFSNPEGDAGDEGRLADLERRATLKFRPVTVDGQ